MNLTLGEQLRQLQGPVLITGHTGFKGTWLTLLLERLDVSVLGLSLPAKEDSLFERARRKGAIQESFIDIRDFGLVAEFMKAQRPAAIFHLAAQPLVLESYRSPRETFATNAMGTANILDAAFDNDSVKAVAVITTDKVYRNDNSGVAFTEDDALAGKDPYSASKVATEAVVAAWQQISKVSGGPKVVSLRAGNVLGGGDWAEDRLVPDLIRAFSSNRTIEVRSPESTRPWQHVLDPLNGYVMALDSVLSGGSFQALNFGPDSKSLSVREITELAQNAWPTQTSISFASKSVKEDFESVELQLDSTLAKKLLGWTPIWEQEAAVISTIDWWDKVLNRSVAPADACNFDLDFLLSREG